jgi:hypothetical protein
MSAIGHKADMLNALTNVRFWGKADMDQPLRIKARHWTALPSTVGYPSAGSWPALADAVRACNHLSLSEIPCR